MRIVALKRAEAAPNGADRITIIRTQSDGFRISGALQGRDRCHIFDLPNETFVTESAALNAGIAWASGNGSVILYVERPVPRAGASGEPSAS